MAEILAESLRRGFYGKAAIELAIQDGTIQHIRRLIERIESNVAVIRVRSERNGTRSVTCYFNNNPVLSRADSAGFDASPLRSRTSNGAAVGLFLLVCSPGAIRIWAAERKWHERTAARILRFARRADAR